MRRGQPFARPLRRRYFRCVLLLNVVLNDRLGSHFGFRMRIGPDTVAVITGGANGIGRALVHEFHERGARVALLDVDEPALAETARTVPGALPVLCDVSDADAVEQAVRDVHLALGSISVLICSAGVSVAGPVEALSLADFEYTLAANFWGVVHPTRASLPHLRRAASSHGEAAVCVVLSDFALISIPTKGAYAASKHAARAFTDALAGELHGSGVAVSAAYPGATATGLVARGRAVDGEKQAAESDFLSRSMSPDYVARQIIRGMERGRRRILIGTDARLLDWATRVSPSLTRWAVERFWRRIRFL